MILLLWAWLWTAAASPLNPHVLDVLEGYPLDGSSPYAWARGQHHDGVTRRLTWEGVEVAAPTAGGGVHCSGITFEVWLRAVEAAGAPPPLTAAEVLALKEVWYVRTGDERGPVGALVDAGLAEPVAALEELRPGDLVQFWRNNGNGHSAIFVGHTYRSSGAVRGMVFWSAQSSSGGLGRRFVSVGRSPAQIAPGRLFAARPLAAPTGRAAAPPRRAPPPGPAAR